MDDLTRALLSSPAGFARLASRGKWIPAKHLLILADMLIQVEQGEIKRLILTLPPRHGKSELVSKYFIAWFLGLNPDKRAILCGYEAEFAASWGYKARALLKEFGQEYFGIDIAADSAARNRWDIAGHEGGMMTAGVGGPITGKGAHLLIIDDPVKNAEEANSKTYRNKTAEWFNSTAYTRLEPDGAVILIQTRWHQDDLAGRQLAEMAAGGEQWTILDLPAIAEEGDPLGREVGAALFPQRYPVEVLEKIKTKIGSYWFNALYQQRPSEAGGTMFKREHFLYYTRDDNTLTLHTRSATKHVFLNQCMIFQTCDPAGTLNEGSDWFVMGTWAKTPDNDLIALDIMRTKLEGPDQPNLFRQSYERWSPQIQGFESKMIGLTVFQMLLRTGLPVIDLKADRDKKLRATPVAARMEAGTVYFPSTATWLGDFEEELIAFPTGKNDDQVDVLAYAGMIIVDGIGSVPDVDEWSFH
ncbi:MAG: phage terminase large subunit [Gammaproteobacteria bacterium]|nr:phage terminase large subunit [Gammaproteobacteria bacterium]